MTDKIKIAYLHSAAGYGGIVKNLSLILNNLDPSAFTPTLISLTEPGTQVQQFEIGNCTHNSIDDRSGFDMKALKQIDAFCRENEIQILSCHGHKADFYGAMLQLLFKTPVKLTTIAHGWVTPGWKMSIYYTLDKICMSIFDSVVLVRDSQRSKIPFGTDSKVSVITNAIDPAWGKNSSEIKNNFREEFDIPSEATVLGFLGRLSPEKGIETTIRALLKLEDDFDLYLLIGGEGKQKAKLNTLIDKLSLQERIKLVGFVEDTPSFYQALDLYVSSSKREGLPNNILEAQVMGVPCIVSRIPGHTDIIEDGVNGVLFSSGSAIDLAEKISATIKEKKRTDSIVTQGKIVIQERFNLKRRISQLEELYSSLAE